MNKSYYNNISAFHPGYYIKDIIEEMSITQEEFANRLGTTPKTISKIVNGLSDISEDIAIKLSNMFGTSVEVWLNLQKEYDCKLAEIEKLKRQAEQENILKEIDYSFFEKVAGFKPQKSLSGKVNALCEYLKIGDMFVLKENAFACFRKQNSECITEKEIVCTNAWLLTMLQIGKNKSVGEYNEYRLKSSLLEIRKMTTENPKDFLGRLDKILSECGVALVLLPSLKSSKVYAATKWTSDSKVVLGITDRYKTLDSFWFSLFHELGHILRKDKVSISSDNNKLSLVNDTKREEEANIFARNILIPKKEYDDFIFSSKFTKEEIIRFANKIDVHSSIVLGRLQKDNLVSYLKYKDLKVPFEISFSSQNDKQMM